MSVSTNRSGKCRLILDLREVNKHLDYLPVKYDDLKIIKQYLEPTSYMFSFDLKSGYHHVEICSPHCKYLGFSWQFSNSKTSRYFVFKVLPFGLSTACHIFTKLLRPLVKRWRRLGIAIVLYLDDGIVANTNEQQLTKQANTVSNNLRNAGFIVNEQKYNWFPLKDP